MTDNLRDVYLDTFCAFIEKRYGNAERENLRKPLDVLFDYADDNQKDIFNFSLEDANSFLIWFEKRKKNMEEYDYLLRIMIEFYNLLVLIDQAPINPFKKLRDLKLEEILKKIKKRFPNKTIINPDTGEEI